MAGGGGGGDGGGGGGLDLDDVEEKVMIWFGVKLLVKIFG